MSRSNLALVEKMYACFNTGDMETIKREVFAENLEWRLPGHHPLAGTKYGADEVIAFFTQLAKSGIKVDLTRIDAFGEEYVVEVHRGHGQAGEARLDAINCTHYHIVNDRIQDVQVFTSNQHAVDLFFNQTYALAPLPGRLTR